MKPRVVSRCRISLNRSIRFSSMSKGIAWKASLSDTIRQDAVIRRFEIIGEAATPAFPMIFVLRTSR